MTLTTGFFKLDRSILKYFKKPYSEVEAWIWMISQAEYNGDGRGRVKGTMKQFAGAWGVSKMTPSRWLFKWANEQTPRISCKYAHSNFQSPHVTGSVTGGVTEDVTGVTVVTLLNYDKYQTNSKTHVTKGVTGGVTEDVTLLKKEEKKRKKTPFIPQTGETVKVELEKVDLPKLRKRFPTKDVNHRWEEFYETCVEGTAKKPRPNPYGYVDFEKGFCTWLRKSPDIITNDNDNSWDTEY